MSFQEQVVWWKVLAFIWGVGVFVLAISTVLPGPNAETGAPVLALIVAVATVLFLLVLSWRAAYISGKKKS